MRTTFPYDNVDPLVISDSFDVDTFRLPGATLHDRTALSIPRNPALDEAQIVRTTLSSPIGTSRLREIAKGKQLVLIVFDDYSRSTPVHRFAGLVLEELHDAGVRGDQITFIAALGTHRPMSAEEMRAKLGDVVVGRYRVLNHAWDDPEALEYLGQTAQGAPVWINKVVRASDLVIGLGAIMPLEVAGFTGGGKILVPGLSGEITVDEMHWTRIDVPSAEVLGQRDNPVRESIDQLAQQAGLDFIVNVILDPHDRIVDAVAGDMVAAHREGCKRALRLFTVATDRDYDIVVADSYPFDVEFWQANKALDTAGLFVKPGGSIILVAPCTEGLSRTHGDEILAHGYRSIATIKELVGSGKLHHRVVGVHMHQVAEAVIEKGATLYLVSGGVPRREIESVGFEWAATPQDALDRAVRRAQAGADTIDAADAHPSNGTLSVAVLKDSARMIVRRE